MMMFGVVAVIMVVLVFAVNARSKSIRRVVRDVAASSGWSNLETMSFVANGVRGWWRQFPVELAYQAEQRRVPQRLTLKLRARTDMKLIVTRKLHGVFWNKPLTWFGPPLIEMHQPAASDLWVRGDAMLADRVFADPAVASLIASNVVDLFDEVKVNEKGIRITRALAERPVRQKYGMPVFTMTFDAQQFAPIAREEIQLAEALAGKLSVT